MRDVSQGLKFFCYAIHVIKGIVYPLLNVSFVALIGKALQLVLEESIDASLYDQVEEQIYGPVRESRATSFYLMMDLTFFQAFLVVVILVVILAILQPLGKALREEYLSRKEVKRVQAILYDKFILEPNALDVRDASDLVYEKTAIVEKYCSAKYKIVDDLTSIYAGLVIFFSLAWDLGLMLVGKLVRS